MTRHDVVDRLIHTALEGMTKTAEETHASNDEIMSAYFSMLRRGIAAALILTQNPASTRSALRESIYVILADVANQKLN